MTIEYLLNKGEKIDHKDNVYKYIVKYLKCIR